MWDFNISNFLNNNNPDESLGMKCILSPQYLVG